MRSGKIKDKAALVCTTEARIRFSETDAMGVVWHGNYAKFFEDGREAFGRLYGLSYREVLSEGFTIPVVEMTCRYRRSLVFGEEITIRTGYIPCDAAKILFEYAVYRTSDNELMASGSTVQVFVGSDGGLQLTCPEFYQEWKRKWKIG